MRVRILLVALCVSLSLSLLAQVQNQTTPAPRKTVRLTDGQTIEGRVLNEGFIDLQLLTDDQRVHLLRALRGGVPGTHSAAADDAVVARA